jgi:hypothetical protein
MIGMNVFTSDAFSAISLTTAIRDVKTVPNYLGSLGIFQPTPSRTRDIFVERMPDGTLLLVPTTEIGGPKTRMNRDRQNGRNFRTVRLRLEDTIRSHELQGMRAFGSETELMVVQTEIAMRQAKIMRRMELTKENMRLGAINGIVLDADGSTVINNWYTEFGISAPSAIAFNFPSLTNVDGFIRQNVIRPMRRALGGRWVPGARIVALCGDTFYDKLIANAEVRAAFLNWTAASQLREGLGKAFESFTYGGVEFVNYRGTDDNSTVAIGTNACRIIPVGVDDVFQEARAPGERFEFVNTLGQEYYSTLREDADAPGEAMILDVATYPLFMCTAPEALLNGTTN